MQKAAAQKLVQETLQDSFNKERFVYLVKNVLNHIEEAPFTYKGNFIFDDFADSINTIERIGKYKDPEDKLIDILIVRLQKETSLERARTKQRNFVAKYLKGSRGGVLKDAALVAFVSPGGDDWRFSLVKMEYKFNEKGKVEEEFTPACRYSFLVGKNENSHTAQSRLLPLLLNDEINPSLKELEDVFSVEKVTKEFFEKYRDLFLKLKESLDEIVRQDKKVKEDFKAKNINTVDFAKKLLGQIVFLYFLQKKGWFGVPRGKDWGEGDKKFLRNLFDIAKKENRNYFNKYLEPLFYEALRLERPKDYYDQFNCRIPFLNGGLFDPINDYDWQDTDIEIPNEIFSNKRKTKEGDTGDGILDVFDRYNFTVKEDEPLEKEVAIDPEMLGKVFENLLEVKDRKSKGTYYTPREIVHYMCQESLANYLATELEEKVSKEDIEMLIKYGETSVEHDAIYIEKKSQDTNYKGRYDKAKLPNSIEQNAKLIDEKLASIRVCDPAVGSGAFPVGMMNEIIRTRNALTPYIGENGERSPYNFKRQAIQNCLYGVDIDPGAVEIAKLRLWLSLIVDEEEREKIQPLPNLDYKIVQGNSLLSVKKNLFNADLFNKLEELKPLYFNETSASKKQKYKKQIDELISQITNGHKEFDFEVYFSEVFHEKKGFDVVIANPPYVSVKEISSADKRMFAQVFETGQGRFNLFTLFLEKGNKVLHPKGILTFILPEGLYSNVEYQYIRKYVLDNTSILFVGLFTERVFEAAVDTSIISMIKEQNPQNKFPIIRDLKNEISVLVQNSFNELPFYLFTVNLDRGSEGIVYKVLSGRGAKIDEILEIQQGIIYSGQPKEKVFSNEAKSPAYKKVLDGRDVLRWLINWKEKRENKFIYYSDKLHRAREERLFLAKEKILFPRKSTQISGAYDDEQYYCLNTAYVCLLKNDKYNIKFILSVLNSTLVNYFYSKLFFGWQVTIPALNCITIPAISLKEQKPYVNLVEQILKITKTETYLVSAAKQAQVRDYEKQIDQLVYKLYGLTPEEVGIIENSAQ